MSPAIAELPRETPPQPLLVFPIGVIGCTPLGSIHRLALANNAQYVSGEQIRSDYIDHRVNYGLPLNEARVVSSKSITQTGLLLAREHLQERQNVVLDMFFNTVVERRKLLQLAQGVGALTVALRVNTPLESAVRRVKYWADEDLFNLPLKKWEVPPSELATNMAASIEPPASEGIDHVFSVNGTSTDKLITQFRRHLGRAKLTFA